MKKIYTLVLAAFLPLLGFSQMYDVVLTIDDSANGLEDTIKVRGAYNGWVNEIAVDDGTNGDATADDDIYTITVQAAEGTYEWGAEGVPRGWLTPGQPNKTFTVDASGNVTGDTSIVIPLDQPTVTVTLTINDQNADVGSMDVKGAYNGWTAMPAYDDGTNGDATAGDNIWTIQVDAAQGSSYEWGAERTDCDNPAWLLQGPNLVFDVDNMGNITGETNYDIPVAGTKYNVTFGLDLRAEIPSGEGVHVSGNFLTCAWDKDDYPMTETSTAGIYTITIPVAPGDYEFKYFNGASGDDVAEAQSGTPDAYVFRDNGCGVDNGIGASNRSLDLSTMTADTVLPIYVWNSCDVSDVVLSTNRPTLAPFTATPNPFDHSTLIDFKDAKGEEFMLTVTNITGQIVRQVRGLIETNYTLERGDLGTGIYLATLTNEKGEFYTHKLVVR